MRRLWRLRRPLRALQVEVTSRCSRKCSVCARSALGERWIEGDLAPETWARLRPDLGLAAHVHLQGWGEPLLHPRLVEMVGDARRAGCAVGLTTNGDMLGEAASELVAAGLDQVAVSLGGDRQLHGELRGGSDLDVVLAGLATLAAVRGRRRRPRIQVSYLLTRPGVRALTTAVEEAARAGADKLFVVHLDCTPTAELLELAAFGSDGPAPGVAEAVADARAAARRAGIAFRGPALGGGEPVLVCAADPLRIVFISWNGLVGPCVSLLPVDGPIPRATAAGTVEVAPYAYGSLAEDGLAELLTGEQRARFTAPFRARLEADRRLLDPVDGLWGRVAQDALDRSAARREHELQENPLPPACEGCHKALGW